MGGTGARVRVDPDAAGPQIGAALTAAAAALTAPAAIPPPVPAGMDPVSVAAANHITVNAGQLSAQLAAGAGRLAEGAQTVATALGRYVASDAYGAALVGGSGGGGNIAGAIAGIDIPVPPAVDIPDLPIDIPAALAAVPPEPDVVDEALRGGAGEGGLEAHAAAWTSAAAQLGESGQSIQQLAGSLPVSWSGPAGEALSGRLAEFGRWMEHSSTAASAHAAAVRRCGSHWSTAVDSHPRAETYRGTQRVMLVAARRAAAGDPNGAAEAARAEAELARMKEQSVQAMNSYGQSAGGANAAVERPGDSPRVSGDGDPHLPDKRAEELGTVAGDDPQASAAGDTGDAAGTSLQGGMNSLMQLPSSLANSVGQSLSKAGQSLGQAGQQPAQAASQLGNMLGSGSPAGGGTPAGGGSPMGGVPRGGSLGKLGDGGAGLGGGGAGGGGRTMPASLPEQQGRPAAVEPAPAASAMPTGRMPKTSGTGGMGGMMPMGMMPHGRKGSAGKELDRNPEWSPDEPLVKDEPEVSEPIAGQRKRARPTET